MLIPVFTRNSAAVFHCDSSQRLRNIAGGIIRSCKPMNTANRYLENERLEGSELLRILSTAPSKDFDNLALFAAQICAAPIALIGILKEQQLCLKGTLGLALNEIAWSNPFWSVALLEPELLIIPDINADERFSSNPLVVGDADVRFYAGTRLITDDNIVLGTLSVVDRRPRELTLEQTSALRVIARQAVEHCELLRAQHLLASALMEKRQYEVK